MKIDELERQQSVQLTAMADPDFFKQEGAEIARAKSRLDALEGELRDLYSRWEELEART